MSDSEDYQMEENSDYELNSNSDTASNSDYIEEDPDFVQGVKQHEHMGEANDVFSDIFEGIYTNKRKYMASLSGEEKFYKLVRDYMSIEFKGINLEIRKYISDINQIKYKNPKAFVLACYFIESKSPDKDLKDVLKKYIEKETVKTLRCNQCKKTEPYSDKNQKCHDENMVLEVSGLQYEDIIRYIHLIRK